MSWFGDKTVPIPGGTVLDDALLDLDETIPNAASKAALVVLHQSPPNRPIGCRQHCIDGLCSMLATPLEQFGDAPQAALVFSAYVRD